LIAFTLVQKPQGAELFAAVRNDGDTPACQPGMTVELYDKAGQHVTSAAAVLQTDRFYRSSDGTVIACVAPGQISMAAATPLPSSVVVDDLGSLQHLFPAFTVPDIVPTAGLRVSGVAQLATDTGGAYAGKLDNGLATPVTGAKAMVFPVNRVHRPLGLALSSPGIDLPAGAEASFRTDGVDDTGSGYLAFPAGSIVQ
jgi:hypothetical protein